MHHRATAAGLFSIILSGACTAAEESRPLAVLRSDSAGVEIVINSTPIALAPVFAELDSVPEVRLGSLDGRPEEQFGTATDLVTLRDGGVAVLDGRAAQVQVFGPEGGFVRSLGSHGDGPGEFQAPIELGLLLHDTIAVFDAQSNRVTRFDPSGTLGRTTRLEGIQARIVAASFLPNGKLITQSAWLPPAGRPLPGPEPTFVRDTAVLLVFDAEGTIEDTVDIVPSQETITSIQVDGSGVAVFRRIAAFGRSNFFAAHPDGVWSSTNDRFELGLVDPANGRLLRIVRAPGLESVTTDRIANLIQDRALAEAETPEDRRRIESWYALSPRPARQPAYDALEVDPLGRLWVREWTSGDLPRRWWVFGRGGGLIGSVHFPSGTVALSPGCNLVWTVERDELDVSYVARYALPDRDEC